MTTAALADDRDGLFRVVRQGLPILAALTCLVLTFSVKQGGAWFLVGAVAAVAEVLPSFRTRDAYLKRRRGLVKRDGLWVAALRPIFRALGKDADWVLSFCAWNNRKLRDAFAGQRARRPLVLLPHCIQLSSCRADVVNRLETCFSCGRCDVQDVLEASLRARWDVRLTNRSHKAYREARALQPDLIVAVSCHDRLLKGLVKLPEIPSYVLPLALPHGMCVDTTFDVSRLIAAMEHFAEPRAAALIEPLRRDSTA